MFQTRRYTRTEFAAHVDTLSRTRPASVWLHHTWRPTLADWRGQRTMDAMQRYYEGLGWDRGPHLFIAPDGIWQMTPLEEDGIHVAGHNAGTIGVEMVGNYDEAPPSGRVKDLVLFVLRLLFGRWGLDPSRDLHFHREASHKTCPGRAVDKALWIALLKRSMDEGSRLSVHTQQPAFPEWLKNDVAAMAPEWVKIMDPDAGKARPFGESVRYIGRLHFGEGEPDKALIEQGAGGADAWWEMARDRIAAAPWVDAWEGPNEPDVTTRQGCENLADFERRRLEILHAHNLAGVSLCLATGNPPNMNHWIILGQALAEADYVALHEYGMRTMALDGWHLLRYRKAREVLALAGMAMPELMITETGIDYSGNKTEDGWRAQGLSAEAFVHQHLAPYDRAARQDGVRVLTPFTWTTSDWVSFLMDRRASEVMRDYVAGSKRGGLEQAMGDEAQRHIISLNPAAALEKAAAERHMLPASPEFTVDYDGRRYVGQAFRHPAQRNRQYIAYCEVGDWGNIQWIERAN